MSLSPQNKTVRKACHQTPLLTMTTNKYFKSESASLVSVIDSVVLEESVESVGGRQRQWWKHFAQTSAPSLCRSHLPRSVKADHFHLCQSVTLLFTANVACRVADRVLLAVLTGLGEVPGSHPRLQKQMKGVVHGTMWGAGDG